MVQRAVLAFASGLVILTSSAVKGIAQEPTSPDFIRVRGIVHDAATGEPLADVFVSVDDRPSSAFTNEQGRFAIAVAVGVHVLHLRRLGYRNPELALEVAEPMAELELHLEPEPVQLQGLDVISEGQSADLRGLVMDATTDEPLAFAELRLTTDGLSQVGRRQSSDESGAFEVSDVSTGRYLLRVEKLGYVPQYVLVLHVIPARLVPVRLEPDTALQRGLSVMTAELEQRRRAWGRSSRTFDEQRLRDYDRFAMDDFFAVFRVLTSCPVYVCLYIDDMPAITCMPRVPCGGRDILASYTARDFYRVEVFSCPRQAGVGGRARQGPRTYELLYLYTYAGMERLAGDPRVVSPPVCIY